jgi:hypothetical protein
MMTSGIFMVSIVFMVIGMIVQFRLKSKFGEYSRTPTSSGLSGKEIAEKMLRDNGITNVQVVSSQGFLSDHYNPINRTVNLSPDVYQGKHVSAAAVAAHECGHAVQHATAYPMLMLRSRMVPVVNVSSRLSQFVLMIGLALYASGSVLGSTVLLVGIALFAAATVFSIITLPVEFDASARALKWLDASRITSVQEHVKAKDALKWAALTYVVSALASIAMLIQYVMLFMGGRRSED